MKKILGTAIALTLGLSCTAALAGCDSCNKSDDEAIAQKAIEVISEMYSAKFNNVESPIDYEVFGEVKVADDTLGTNSVEISWSVSSAVNNIDDYIKIGSMNESSKLIKVSVTKPGESVGAVDYKLTATAKFGKASKSVDFNRKIPAGIDRTEETETVTLEFDATKSNRVSQDGQKQVWQQNGITFTNEKGNSSNDVADYAPVRLYQSSTVTIEYPGIKHIDFTCVTYSGSDYATGIKTGIENAGIPATIVVSEDLSSVSVELEIPVDSLTFTVATAARVSNIAIEALVDGITDADKIAMAEATLKLGQTLFISTGDVTLPTESYGADIAWSVKGGTSEYVSVSGSTLTIVKLPDADTPVTLVADITKGTAEKKTKEIEITVCADLGLTHAGTETDPYTPTEANTRGSKLDADAWTDEPVYVKGYVVTTGSWSGGNYNNYTGVYIGDTAETAQADAFQVYRLVADGTYITTSGTDLKVGQLITVKGYIQNYKGNTPEMAAHGGLNVYVVDMEVEEDTRTDEEKAQAALDALTLTTVTENISLTSSVSGVTLSITSSTNTTAIALNGTVTRPDAGQEDVSVTITVQAVIGEATKTKDFNVTVKAKASISHAGTLEDPYTPSEAKNVGANLASGAFTDTAVYVKGYVIDAGSWSAQYNNYSYVWLGDTADTVKDTDGAFYAYRIDADGTYVTGTDGVSPLETGKLVTVMGFITNYNGTTPEFGKQNNANGVVVAIDGFVEKTPQEKADAAIAALSVPATVTSNLSFADSNGVSFAITSSTNTTAIALDGTVTRPDEGQENVSVTITVTASIDGATATKDFTVTVKAKSTAVGTPASLSFATTDNRLSTSSTASQIWQSDDLIFTNAKGSGSDINLSYSNPIRCYQNSTIKVEYASGINKIVFVCGTYQSNDYGKLIVDSIGTKDGVSVTQDGVNVTVEFNSAVTEFEFTCSAQIRIMSISVNPAD